MNFRGVETKFQKKKLKLAQYVEIAKMAIEISTCFNAISLNFH